MAISVKHVGHVVLKVRDLDRSAAFYRDILGLKEVARYRGVMAFFSAGSNHHDLAVLAIGPEGQAAPRDAVGLYHVALKIGDHLDDLRAARAHLAAHGVRIRGTADHRVSQSIYLEDPDGNMIELFVDADPALWRDEPSIVATTEPLDL